MNDKLSSTNVSGSTTSPGNPPHSAASAASATSAQPGQPRAVGTAPATPRAPQWVKRLSIITGVVGMILFVLTPFMPIRQVQSSIDWPQGTGVESVSAPLISYAPQELQATIPLAALQELNSGQTTVLSTLPGDSEEPTARGLFVRYGSGGLDVVVRNKVALEATKEQLEKLPATAALTISSTDQATTASIPGTDLAGTLDGDVRPQLTGIYTELDPDSAQLEQLRAAGLSAHVDINSRFTSSPSPLKYATMFGGLLALVISLWCLHKMDVLDGRVSHRVLPRGFFRPRLVDAVVVLSLLYWYIFGANTSDDGYLLTMARASADSGYMSNYYRWFGVPESPFGAPYYDLLGLMARVSTSSVWMRLPELIAAILTWLIISREVLPRLGVKINARKVAHWTAAFSFLGFWMVYNNGLRPEPVIALGALLTWVSIERAIATSRLLPAALGVIIATVSLGAGPTGLMAVAALVAGFSGLIRIVTRRLPLLGVDMTATPRPSRGAVFAAVAAMLAPFLSAGTAILLAVFGDQSLATVLESIRVRGEKGPSLQWYEEWVRYQTLMQQNVDGSFTRRFAVLMMLLCLGLVLASVLRNGHVPGSAKGPSNRLMMVFFGTMFFMMFTPTKWTHHFGVYAGIGAALAALAAVAISHMAMERVRNRTLFIGTVLFLLAISLSGTNGWWYISSFGVPWWDKTIQYHHVQASNVVLAAALVVLLIAAVQSFITDARVAQAETSGHSAQVALEDRRAKLARFNGVAAAPIAVATALVTLFAMLSLAKGFVSQYPAYSIGLGNLRSVKGDTCNLANDAMLETNTNASFLSPLEGSLADSLEVDTRGFGPDNIPAYIPQAGVNVDNVVTGSVAGSTDAQNGSGADAGQSSSINGGVRAQEGVNGSKAQLPFDLDYQKVPVVGSYTVGAQFPAQDISSWYELPQRSEQTPLLVISAAGTIEHHDINGVYQRGQKLVVEYGTFTGQKDAEGNPVVRDTGTIEPMVVGPAPAWRNLRIPMEQIPPEATVVRIVAEDNNLDPDQWLAFTPPRVPTLDSLNSVIGSEQPGLLDWSVALQFPCQRPFGHYAGVAETPVYRVSPDYPGKVTLSPWQDYNGGGVMGLAEALNTSVEMPGYLKDDWGRDWGSIEKYSLRTNSLGQEPVPAKIEHTTVTRSGLWNPGPMKISDSDQAKEEE